MSVVKGLGRIKLNDYSMTYSSMTSNWINENEFEW